ncbi:MAG: hypothetical protein K8T10_16855 [Candidatus Eremiobacteraeota bacterium]|nr:hypothetical protein [Candidatus Eremiobacteraeota bacterium]
MANPLDYTRLVIKMSSKPTKDGSRKVPILHPNGKKVGEVALSQRPFPDKILRRARFPEFFRKFFVFFPNFALKFEVKILDSEGKLLLRMEKPFSFKKFILSIYDQAGRKLGVLEKVPPDTSIDEVSKKSEYHLFDYKGKLVGIFRGDWGAWNMQILDSNQKAVGKLSKSYTDVNKVIHGYTDIFAAEIYEFADDVKFRVLIMGVASAMDIIAKE